MSAVDPPNPIPEHLWPQRGTLGDEDLRMAASTAELRVVARLLDHERLAGYAMLTQRDGSPWLEVSVAVPAHDESRSTVRPELDHLPDPTDRVAGLGPCGVFRFAIWRYTGKAYRVDAHGAVEDDPIELA